jgi:glutaminase
MKPTFLNNYLENLHKTYAPLTSGEVASYIPELLKADPAWFGIALATVDGHVYQAGDTAQPFTIQSISKVFTYGMALQDQGLDNVLRKIGVEPSGEAFNSISLEPGTGRPMNPMINAGAIATTSLIHGPTPEARLGRLLETLGQYCGRKLKVDEAVYQSEKATGHRNRAIAHLLVNYGIIEGDPEPSLDLYFRQCSVLVTCRDLAVMAATLANQGVNPITSVRAVKAGLVPRMLSAMASCGMYDYSGEWIYNVGMPAKSGVGGGIIAVLPGRFGLAVFAPPLDAKGNSVRGIAVCKAVSADFQLHMLQAAKATAGSVVRARYDLATVGSKRTRAPEAARRLAETGQRAVVFELAGELDITSAELILFEASTLPADIRYLIADFRRVSSVDAAAAYLLAGLVQSLEEQGTLTLFTGTAGIIEFEKHLRKYLPGSREQGLLDHASLDYALEWCETRLLEEASAPAPLREPLALADHYVAQGLTPAELECLEALLETRTYARGDYLCREGDEDSVLHLLVAGEVSVVLRRGEREVQRVAALSAGTAIGELAMFTRAPRSADVVADTEVTVRALDYRRLEADPSELALNLRLKLMKNLAVVMAERLRKANREIRSVMQ